MAIYECKRYPEYRLRWLKFQKGYLHTDSPADDALVESCDIYDVFIRKIAETPAPELDPEDTEDPEPDDSLRLSVAGPAVAPPLTPPPAIEEKDDDQTSRNPRQRRGSTQGQGRQTGQEQRDAESSEDFSG